MTIFSFIWPPMSLIYLIYLIYKNYLQISTWKEKSLGISPINRIHHELFMAKIGFTFGVDLENTSESHRSTL